MALEQVAGPFPLLLLDGTPLTDLTTTAFKVMYADDVGLFGYSGTLAGLCVIQLDGTVCRRSTHNRANQFTLDLQRKGEFFIHASLFEEDLYYFDKRAMLFQYPAFIESAVTNYVYYLHVRCADRWLQVITNRIESRPLDLTTGAWATECSLVKTGSTNIASVSLTADKDVILIAYTSGEIIFYNHVLQEQTDVHLFVAANVGTWYSPKFDIYISLRADDTLSIYSSEIVPATIGAITAVSPLTRGRVSIVKVRLTGAASEPCVGEFINWIVYGAGVLKVAQSVTDSDGYAWNECIVSPLAPVGADIDITANVRF